MALSNYDTLAVNEKSETTNGTFRSPAGVEVAIYKNWLYVRDAKAWAPDSGWNSPTIMQIESGEVNYKDVVITARRGPQNGVYAIVTHTTWRVKEEPIRTAMIGCGVYGYEGDEFVGVEAASKTFLRAMLDESDDWLRAVSLDGVSRFNQGDAFIARNLDLPVPTTPVGAAEPTLMSQVIE